MQKAARVNDLISHGGNINNGSPNVFINNMPAAIASISQVCCGIHPPSHCMTVGSATVFINSLPAVRVNDFASCGATITKGSDDVFIG